MIMHADRFKPSRTNAEQNQSCDVDREKRRRGTQRRGVNNGGAEEKRETWRDEKRLCVEVIHRFEKTGGRYKGKNKRVTVIIQIFVRSEVKAECG